jgi:hypothetical protein
MRLLLLALLLTLGGCGWFDSAPAAQGGTVQGEVLPGSASDAMIPLDQVKSQAPLAPKAEGGDQPGAKDPVKAKAGADAPVAAAPVEAPDAPAEEVTEE